MDDVQIIKLFLLRDEMAITAAQEKYNTRLLSIARNILGNDEDAEECVNDTWLEAWNRIPPHEPYEYLSAFLSRIVRMKALNRARALSAEKRSAELVSLTDELANMLSTSSYDPEAMAEAGDLAAAVCRYIRSISDKKRQVFVHRYWYAESIAGIAELYCMSESRVKSLLWRVRKELEKQLKKEGFLL